MLHITFHDNLIFDYVIFLGHAKNKIKYCLRFVGFYLFNLQFREKTLAHQLRLATQRAHSWWAIHCQPARYRLRPCGIQRVFIDEVFARKFKISIFVIEIKSFSKQVVWFIICSDDEVHCMCICVSLTIAPQLVFDNWIKMQQAERDQSANNGVMCIRPNYAFFMA